MLNFSLVVPSFIAGMLTFLAPCTLPLVPGYLGFISGVSLEDLKDPTKVKLARAKIFWNGIFYVIGFSLIFIVLGSLFGIVGSALGQYRIWLSRIGGIFVILFGLFLMNILKLSFFQGEKQFRVSFLKPGSPLSSFIFGASFAFGWTPCVGPILGSILLLASTSATIAQGAFLLTIFSAGLAVPFLLVALGIGRATESLNKITKYLNVISIIGGAFLIFLGILLLTNKFGFWISYFYRLFKFINYERILDFL